MALIQDWKQGQDKQAIISNLIISLVPYAKLSRNLMYAGIWFRFLCFLGHFFWARHVRSGDIVDIKFKKNQNIRAVYIVTGFDREEERAGTSKFYLCCSALRLCMYKIEFAVQTALNRSCSLQIQYRDVGRGGILFSYNFRHPCNTRNLFL